MFYDKQLIVLSTTMTNREFLLGYSVKFVKISHGTHINLFETNLPRKKIELVHCVLAICSSHFDTDILSFVPEISNVMLSFV